MASRFEMELGPLAGLVKETLDQMAAENMIARIWDRDHTVWKNEPREIANRLGWLESPWKMEQGLSEIAAFVQEAKAAGFTHALLLGMGGSSMAPEVFRETFGVGQGFLDLAVLDSTDPGLVLERTRRSGPARTLYIVSTKSGGTVETLSLTKYCFGLAMEAVGRERAGDHFIVITDPGSSLEAMAKEFAFRHAFLNDPDIGGRYSALSFFGLAPAALAGVDASRLLQSARAMAGESRLDPAAGKNTPALLGAVLGALAKAGRDKLTLVLSPSLRRFGAWAEQLVAESTGKEGKGILPVDGEPLLGPEAYGPDRLFVEMRLAGEDPCGQKLKDLSQAGHPVARIVLDDPYDLGGEFFCWEMATAVAGAVLGINPFDQPNVESAKVLAREMVARYREQGALPLEKPVVEENGLRVFADFPAESVAGALQNFLSFAVPGSYVAIQAYVTPGPAMDAALDALRAAVLARTGKAVTVGYGPRFLHSTGQLHKGDAGRGLFLQISEDMPKDAPIPENMGRKGSFLSFGALKTAQMLGDGQALAKAGRRVMRLDLGAGGPAALGALASAF